MSRNPCTNHRRALQGASRPTGDCWLRSEMLIARLRIRSMRCWGTLRASCPSVRAAALAAEDHSAEFIAQAVSRFRILLVAETLSEGEKLLLLSLVCVASVL